MKNLVLKTLVISISALALVACDNSDNDVNTNVQQAAENNANTDNTAKAKSTISFKPTNLENLGDNYEYEGWIVKAGKATSTGKFDIEADKKEYQFEVDKTLTDNAEAFVLSIEPAEETGEALTAPSATKILGGDIQNSMTTATTSHKAAFGTDFSAMTSGYILATPTNGFTNPTQGIWYNNLGDFPELIGWKYEGWIVDNGKPITTGSFTDTQKADSDGAGPAAGPQPTNFPPEPGQDFINPAKDLVGKTAVISIEPYPDNSDMPFSIKPLVGEITSTGTKSLTNKAAASLPSATVEIMNK